MTAPRYLSGGRRRVGMFRSAFELGLWLLVGVAAWVLIAVAAYLAYAVVGLAAPALGATSRPSSSTVALWDRVADCETGGDWRMRGLTYSGGVGFANTTWTWWARELGLEARYPNAADAPRLVQIRVADYGRRVHRGYWGCL